MILPNFPKLSAIFFLFSLHCVSALDPDEFSFRLADFKERSISHEERIANLLSKPPLKKIDYTISKQTTIKEAEQSPPDPPITPQIPFVPVPEYYENLEQNDSGFSDTSVEDISSDIMAGEALDSAEEEPINSSQELEDAYAMLYQSDPLIRRIGYYFGPLVGFCFPQDGAVRTSGLHIPHESDNGYQIGFNFGKDFGKLIVEGEYSFLSNEASGGLEVGSHNFLTRLILEKEIGQLIDLRAGLGMGLGFVGIESSTIGDFDGVGFAYDFLLGLGFNLGENWAVNFDYRFFLTAANDNYDRLKSHALIFSSAIAL